MEHSTITMLIRRLKRACLVHFGSKGLWVVNGTSSAELKHLLRFHDLMLLPLACGRTNEAWSTCRRRDAEEKELESGELAGILAITSAWA